MSTNTKQNNIFAVLKNMFSSELDIEENNTLETCSDEINEKTMKALEKANESTDEMGKAAEEFLVTTDRIKKEMLNIDRVIHANTEAAMREYYRKRELEKNKDGKDKEINK